jgi:hypothetical protein
VDALREHKARQNQRRLEMGRYVADAIGSVFLE